MKPLANLLALSALAALAACDTRTDENAGMDETPAATATPDPNAPVSIIRPDVEQPDLPVATLDPLELTIGFPEGGTRLDEAGIAALELALVTPQVTEGGSITLRGHSDASGDANANMRASRGRAEAVRDWLVENDVDESRITIIAFGEQNPVQPNALPDGSPNSAGRAANRRVDITVTVTAPDAPPIMESEETEG